MKSVVHPGPIVVGVERSERSRDALALARTLARAVGTGLLLIAAFPSDARSASMERGAYARALAEEAESTLDWVARPLTGVLAQSRALPCTSVARGLQQVAEAEDALAIVVGPSHRGSLGRIVPGSVGERLLQEAPCPVAVPPRGYAGIASTQITRVGVGYVGTPEADEVLSAAVGLARRTGAAIRVLSVVEPPTVTASLAFGVGYGELEETAREGLTSGLLRVVDVGAPVEISDEVVDGYADDELAWLSDEVDLLVCGSRGHGPIENVMVGSVSTGVLRKARCPIVIVPRGASDGFAALRAPTVATAS